MSCLCFNKYSKKYVNLYTLIITSIVFIIIQVISNVISYNINSNTSLGDSKEVNTNELESVTETLGEIYIESDVEELDEELDKEQDENIEYSWQLEIPKIDLIGEIKSGTSLNVIEYYIGHFETTSNQHGNVGLIAHNQGYSKNHFERLKELKKGDEIKYKYYDFEKTYYVISNEIIKDTDWSKLGEEEENIVTLITCVENEPDFRRCVQAIEIFD